MDISDNKCKNQLCSRVILVVSSSQFVILHLKYNHELHISSGLGLCWTWNNKVPLLFKLSADEVVGDTYKVSILLSEWSRSVFLSKLNMDIMSSI